MAKSDIPFDESAAKRNSKGQFGKGAKVQEGRKRKKPEDDGDFDVAALRERILRSWNTVNGDKVLKEIAKTAPTTYAKLVASVLPKDVGPEVAVKQVNIILFEQPPPKDWKPVSTLPEPTTKKRG